MTDLVRLSVNISAADRDTLDQAAREHQTTRTGAVHRAIAIARLIDTGRARLVDTDGNQIVVVTT